MLDFLNFEFEDSHANPAMGVHLIDLFITGMLADDISPERVGMYCREPLTTTFMQSGCTVEEFSVVVDSVFSNLDNWVIISSIWEALAPDMVQRKLRHNGPQLEVVPD